MSGASTAESDRFDDLDVRIVHGLQIAPRVPFAVLAQALEVSEQTVARRYRRLRRHGAARVVGLVDPQGWGQQNWSLRLACRPNAASSIATALARRDDVHWVALLSGGTEVCCVLRARTDRDRDRLLLDQLPRTAHIDAIEAYGVLHVFRGSSTADWRLGGHDLLTDGQRKALQAHAIETDGRSVQFTPQDEPLIAELMSDGRATYAALAAAAADGRTEAQVRRRMLDLCAAGIVYFDVDVLDAVFGNPVQANLMLTVSPAHLQTVGDALGAHDAVRYAAATTGSASIVAMVALPTVAALYRLVADEIGRLDGVGQVQVLPISRAVKQAGSLLE